MLIDFNSIEETPLQGFKGGEKHIDARIFYDGTNRIMKFRMIPGSSIGVHTHDDSSEIMFFTKGRGHVIYEGERLEVREGDTHYCAKGHTHTLINDSDGMLELTAVVAKQ